MRLEVGELAVPLHEIHWTVVDAELGVAALWRQLDPPPAPVAVTEEVRPVLEAESGAASLAGIQDAIAIAIEARIPRDLACVWNAVPITVASRAGMLAHVEKTTPIAVEPRMTADLQLIGDAIPVAVGAGPTAGSARDPKLRLANIEYAVPVTIRLSSRLPDFARVQNAVVIAVKPRICSNLTPIADPVLITVGHRLEVVREPVAIAISSFVSAAGSFDISSITHTTRLRSATARTKPHLGGRRLRRVYLRGRSRCRTHQRDRRAERERRKRYRPSIFQPQPFHEGRHSAASFVKVIASCRDERHAQCEDLTKLHPPHRLSTKMMTFCVK
jgi:hypothetical protein